MSKYFDTGTGVDPFLTRKGIWQDYILIHNFIQDNALSRRVGDSLLNLVRKIAESKGLKVNLPNSFKTIDDAVKNCVKGDYLLQSINFKYPSMLINSVDFPNAELSFMGAFLNPLQVIAEYLLQVKYTDFVFKPQHLVDGEGKRFYTHYGSGSFFHQVCQTVQETHGPDVVVICMDFNFDTMALDLLGKRSLKPFKLRFKNMTSAMIGKECNILTVGYGPVDMNSKAEVSKMLEKRVHTKAKRNNCLTYMKRYPNQPFPTHFMKPYKTVIKHL
jgi:hypothetical protein